MILRTLCAFILPPSWAETSTAVVRVVRGRLRGVCETSTAALRTICRARDFCFRLAAALRSLSASRLRPSPCLFFADLTAFGSGLDRFFVIFAL
jgi:hypothetical protein